MCGRDWGDMYSSVGVVVRVIMEDSGPLKFGSDDKTTRCI